MIQCLQYEGFLVQIYINKLVDHPKIHIQKYSTSTPCAQTQLYLCSIPAVTPVVGPSPGCPGSLCISIIMCARH